MAEYKCGDCFHAELCEKSEMLVGFSRDNPAYCGMFLNSADVATVRNGRWEDSIDEWLGTDVYTCSKCRESYVLVEGTPKENLWHYCPNCGCRMDGGDDE